MLLDSAEDVVFGEILVFTNIFEFPRLNKAQKWTKIVNFGYVSFEEKLKILKNASNTVFVNERIPLLKILAKSSDI